MSSTTLLTLPRELRDMIVQLVLHSPQPELDFDQLVYFSTDFIVASAQAIAPANLLSTCRQLREDTLYLMEFWDRTPRLKIHIKRTHVLWEIYTSWSVPPSACAHPKKRKIDSMTIDLKPRNNANT